MLACAELFINDLKSKELNYSVKESSDGDVIVAFPFDSKNTNFVFSGDNGTYVSMYTVFESVPDDKLADMYVICNKLNSTFKWLKFYIDKDNDVMVQDDAILSVENAADECFELLLRRINILKEAKAVIMRGLYI